LAAVTVRHAFLKVHDLFEPRALLLLLQGPVDNVDYVDIVGVAEPIPGSTCVSSEVALALERIR